MSFFIVEEIMVACELSSSIMETILFQAKHEVKLRIK